MGTSGKTGKTSIPYDTDWYESIEIDERALRLYYITYSIYIYIYKTYVYMQKVFLWLLLNGT